ncbi:MAG: thioredoxin family protein [Gammaproteobacteria bacterium]|nr:thioredoxin family protein [Gammaproteobacteria bacterium]
MNLAKLAVILWLPLFVSCSLERPDGALNIGQQAPSLRTKKSDDVGGDLSRLTSYRYPDARMYKLSVDEALALGKPIVLEFATPGHCTVCDKQLQMLKSMMDKYGDQVAFLHMDQYMNPEAFVTYQVKGDPWTFIIDKNGIVRSKQPGRVLYQEMDYMIGKVVEKAQG